jgi:hypothetical protein
MARAPPRPSPRQSFGVSSVTLSYTVEITLPDGRFPDEAPIEVRYPRSKREEHGDRSAWPWLPGSILEQCDPDEWYVCVEVRELAVLRDGRRAPRGTASRNLYYPCCFRDSSEIRPLTAPGSAIVGTRRGASR